MKINKIYIATFAVMIVFSAAAGILHFLENGRGGFVLQAGLYMVASLFLFYILRSALRLERKFDRMIKHNQLIDELAVITSKNRELTAKIETTNQNVLALRKYIGNNDLSAKKLDLTIVKIDNAQDEITQVKKMITSFEEQLLSRSNGTADINKLRSKIDKFESRNLGLLEEIRLAQSNHRDG